MATIAVVHGLWHDAHAWFDCVRQLRVFGHSVHLIPIAGHGKRPRGDVSHQQCVASICDYAHVCRFCDVIFVGHSSGAAWLVEAASRMPPGVVDRIILDSPLLPPTPQQSAIEALPPDLRQLFEVAGQSTEAAPCVSPPSHLLRRYLGRGLSDAFCDRFQRHYLRPQPCRPLATGGEYIRAGLSEVPFVVMEALDNPLRGPDAATGAAQGVRRSFGLGDDVPVDIVEGVNAGLAFLSRPKDYARLLLAAANLGERRRSIAGADPSRVWMDWQSFGDFRVSSHSSCDSKSALDFS